MSAVTYEKIIEVIRSCSFLPADLISKWEKNLPQIPKSFYPLFLKTFEEAKKSMDSLYVEFELSRDSTNKYRGLIQDESLQAVKLLKSSKLSKLKNLIDCKKAPKMV
jgi:hypothetical protein